MQSTAQEVEGQSILAKLAREQKAEAILAEPAAPGAIVIGLNTGLIAAVLSYLLQNLALPNHLVAIIVGLTCAVSVIAIEQWSLRRRLEAAIEIIKAQRNPNGA